jgi:hypothetical protein
MRPWRLTRDIFRSSLTCPVDFPGLAHETPSTGVLRTAALVIHACGQHDVQVISQGGSGCGAPVSAGAGLMVIVPLTQCGHSCTQGASTAPHFGHSQPCCMFALLIC